MGCMEFLRLPARMLMTAFLVMVATPPPIAQGQSKPTTLKRSVQVSPPTSTPGCSRPIALQASQTGQFVCAEGGGGASVTANRSVAGPWETFQLIDLNCGEVADGDAVQFKTSSGHFLVAEGGGGADLKADRAAAGPWETFTIVIEGGGVLRPGSLVSLRSSAGNFIVAEGGGGGSVNANRTAIGPWEKFVAVLPGVPAIAPRPAAPFRSGLSLPDAATMLEKCRVIAQSSGELLRMDRSVRDALPEAVRRALPEVQIRSRIGNEKDAAFDWTPFIPNWPAKSQGQCGSCYVFAAAGAFEASYYIRNGVRISVSEQCLLDGTNPLSGCDPPGGWSADPLTQLATLGVAGPGYAYTATKGTPRADVARPYRALAWGFVGNKLSPSVAEIKHALIEHGPLTLPVLGDGSAATIAPATLLRANHELTLVGWDDARGAWRVRNSWLPWGENGYGWVGYQQEGMGNPVLWVEALCDRYTLPSEFDVLGFHVKLEQGTASPGAGVVTLSGKISIWQINNPALKLVLSSASMTIRGVSGAWAGYEGTGDLTVVDGAVSQSLGRGAVRASSAGVASGEVAIVRLHHTFNVSYSFSRSGVSGRNTWNGGDAGWVSMPGADGAEFHVVSPRVELLVENALSTLRFCCNKVQVRTKGTNPAANNAPWASFEMNPPCSSVTLGLDLDLLGRQFPNPGDPNRSRRVTCELACPSLPAPPAGSRPNLPGPARDAYDGAYRIYETARKAHDDCVQLCVNGFPPPPPVPTLPRTITINVEVVVR